MDIMTIINEQALQLQQMRREMQEYEEKYMLAKANYDTANEILARQMSTSGIFSCLTERGSKVEVVSKVSCTIAKDKRHDVAEWLRKLGMADKVKVTATVTHDYIPLLDKEGIQYQENEEVNTNTVKGLITSMMKDNKMSMDSIPRGVIYTQLNRVKIDGQ